MKIDSKCCFFIYGASLRGKHIFETLDACGYQVVSFIDKRADTIGTFMGIPVSTIDEIPKLVGEYPSIVGVITISNVFSHLEIARELANKGVRYIIYKNVFNSCIQAKVINEIYDDLFATTVRVSLEQREIPLFCETSELVSKYGEEYNNDAIVVTVPIELLFGLTKEFYKASITQYSDELYNLIPDRSLLYFTISKDLMCFFEGQISQEAWEQYLQIYFEQRRNICGSTDVNEEMIHLKDRYEVYQNMELLYSTNISFFENNPLEVKWNEKGYYNIEDGNNRAAFLFAKGWNMLPCKMKKSDYDKWINKEILSAVDEVVNKNDIDILEYPILHPYYSAKIYRSFPHAVNKLKFICNWMYRNHIETHGLKVLDVLCRNGYFGQCFTKMGSIVSAIEEDDYYYSVCRQINELLYCSVNLHQDLKKVEFQKFDLIIIPLWAYKIIDKAIKIAAKYYIIDVSDRETINQILEKYPTLQLQVLDSNIHEAQLVYTGIFAKG